MLSFEQYNWMYGNDMCFDEKPNHKDMDDE